MPSDPHEDREKSETASQPPCPPTASVRRSELPIAMPLMSAKSFLPFASAGAAGALVASLLPLLLDSSHAETRLLPFQGRLTDATGTAVADGARVVEFKMYDAPTGGSIKWAGEVHKLSVNGGLVNTMLGSKASLGSVDFATPTYLQITIDANNDNQITAADPPLLPRQSVVPSVYAVEAGNSRQLGAFPAAQYQAVFDGQNPASGWISGAKIKPASLPMSVFTADSITAEQIGTGQVGNDELASQAVTLEKLASRTVTSTPAALGQIAMSEPTPTNQILSGSARIVVPGLTVTLTTSGRRPVMVALQSEGSDGDSFIRFQRDNNDDQVGRVALIRNSEPAFAVMYAHVLNLGVAAASGIALPPSAYMALDTPPQGTHTYKVELWCPDPGDLRQAHRVRLVAFEL